MAKIYYQEDCNISMLEGKTIAVHNISFEYHPKTNDNFKYYWNGKLHRYFPDFYIVKEKIITIQNIIINFVFNKIHYFYNS